MDKQEFDPKDFLEHATQDEFWASNKQFPVIYRNLKKGDDVLKVSEGLGGSEQRRYLRVDIEPTDDRIVQADRKIVVSHIQSLFQKGTTEGAYRKPGQSYYEQHSIDADEKKVIPLSELLEGKMGECVEMATVTQLLAQERGDTSYLVSGHLEEGKARIAHTWNIIEKDNAYYVFDAKNNFKSKITSIVFENGRYFLKTEKEVPFRYCLD